MSNSRPKVLVPALEPSSNRHPSNISSCQLLYQALPASLASSSPPYVIPTFLFFNKFIYLFILAALGLRCCMRAFSSCGERGLLFVAVRGLLVVVASLAAEHGL